MEACNASTAATEPNASIDSSMNGPSCPPEKLTLAEAFEPGAVLALLSLTKGAHLGSLDEALTSAVSLPPDGSTAKPEGMSSSASRPQPPARRPPTPIR